VTDPFHQTLNAAIVDFYIHGEGEWREHVLSLSISLMFSAVVTSSCHAGSLLETENGIRRTDIFTMLVKLLSASDTPSAI
jgi:hypothetical protein